METMTDFDGPSYQARFDALVEQGVDIHGEAALVRRFDPRSVLDAGCGTGRVAIELARHGIEVVGVDVSNSMIAEARRRDPSIEFIEHDLATLDLARTFEIVLLAGNVPLFCPEPDRAALVERCATHVAAGGLLVSGFSLERGYELSSFGDAASAAGFVVRQRWSTWDEAPFGAASDYAVSVHHRRE